MLNFLILGAVLVIAAAAAIVIVRNRRLRARQRSRFFSVSLAGPDAPAIPDEPPR